MLSKILDSKSLVLGARGLEDLRFCCAIVTIWPDAVKLQANTGGTWPRVGGCGIALYFSSPAALTGSHDWNKQLAFTVRWEERGSIIIQLGVLRPDSIPFSRL